MVRGVKSLRLVPEKKKYHAPNEREREREISGFRVRSRI